MSPLATSCPTSVFLDSDDNVIIVTTNDISGYEVVQVLGEVFGLIVRARNVFSNFGASLRTLFGGEVGGYTTLDANLGYALGRVRLTLEGTNLTNQRPPVTSSEFGSQSFYLLPARMTWLRIGYSWR